MRRIVLPPIKMEPSVNRTSPVAVLLCRSGRTDSLFALVLPVAPNMHFILRSSCRIVNRFFEEIFWNFPIPRLSRLFLAFVRRIPRRFRESFLGRGAHYAGSSFVSFIILNIFDSFPNPGMMPVFTNALKFLFSRNPQSRAGESAFFRELVDRRMGIFLCPFQIAAISWVFIPQIQVAMHPARAVMQSARRKRAFCLNRQKNRRGPLPRRFLKPENMLFAPPLRGRAAFPAVRMDQNKRFALSAALPLEHYVIPRLRRRPSASE